jgi:hypothetical protein
MIGRGLRPADGKTDVVILDHSGAVHRHGRPEDHVKWTLDPDRRAESPEHQKRLRREAARQLECTQCSALRLAGQPCPACGFLPQRPAQYVAHVEGELVEFGTRPMPPEIPDRRRWHAMLRAAAIERGKSAGWAFYLYQQKFHEKPRWAWRNETWPPTDEVRAWVRSRVIAYAKAQAKAQGAA